MRRIYLEITPKCGLSCSFCPPHKQTGEPMPIALFERAAAQAASLTREVSLHVMGDPLTVGNLADYLDICANHGLKVGLTTAGHLVNESRYPALLHPAIKQVNFSVASFAANPQKIALEAYLAPLIAYAQTASQTDRIFTNFRLWNLDGKDETAAFNNAVLAVLARSFAVEKREDFAQLAPRVRLVYDALFAWPDPHGAIVAERGTCHGASGQLAVLSDGRVVPCCLDSSGAIELGNVADQTLKEVLQTLRVRRLRDGFKRGELIEPLCRRCGYRTRFD
ncbi:MAG: radical SAM/SPASM domain-containing protein [Campylobacterales bacterium]